MSRCLGFALLLMLAMPARASDAAYDAWAAGRPAEALPALHAAALASGRWDAWLDLGLAAAEDGRRGPAAAWLVAAHQRAPHRAEPRQALAALGSPLPAGWLAHLGIIAWPGAGPWALPLALLAGAALGWALVGRRGRGWAGWTAALIVIALAPGALAARRDGGQGWAAITADSALLDASGRVLRPLPAGTLVERCDDAPWAGQIAVQVAGTHGWVAAADLVANP